MNILRSKVRQIILQLKASEERQKRCKEKLVNFFRTQQKHPIKSERTSITKQLLVQIKDTDELNKSSKSILHKMLVKISEWNFENTNQIPRVNKKQPPSGNSIPLNEKQHSAEIRNHFISLKDEPDHQSEGNRIHDLAPTNCNKNAENEDILVKLTNYFILSMLRKFTGKITFTRMGIG